MSSEFAAIPSTPKPTSHIIPALEKEHPTAIALITLLALTAGILAWCLGRRGRKTGDHPTCRQCRFDLFGLPPDVTRCSECGADLAKPKAILPINRQSLSLTIILGKALILLSLAGFIWTGFLFHDWWPTPEAAPWKPAFILFHEFANSRAAKDPRFSLGTHWIEPLPAYAELCKRLADGRLTNAQLEDFARRILQWQADPKITWNPFWGEFLVQARTARGTAGISDALFQQFLAHRLLFEVDCRKRTERGHPLPLKVRVVEVRQEIPPPKIGSLGSGDFEKINMKIDVNRFSATVTTPKWWRSGNTGPTPGQSRGPFLFGYGADTPENVELWNAIPSDGPVTFKVEVIATVSGIGLVGTSTSVIYCSTDVLPRGHHSATPIHPAGISAAINASFDPFDDIQLPSPSGGLFLVFCNSFPPPVNIAAEVHLVQGGSSVKSANDCIMVKGAPEGFSGGMFDSKEAAALHVGPAELVLTPSELAAAETIDIEEYWDTEIRLPIKLIPAKNTQ